MRRNFLDRGRVCRRVDHLLPSAAAHAGVVYESAQQGPTGQSAASGITIDYFRSVGVRFQITDVGTTSTASARTWAPTLRRPTRSSAGSCS
jgi:hypothetical protein